jgi:hypothetical protein
MVIWRRHATVRTRRAYIAMGSALKSWGLAEVARNRPRRAIINVENRSLNPFLG